MKQYVESPPHGGKVREIVADRIKQAQVENSAKITVDWRGEQKHLYVISMPVSLLFLNPDTHRIRAQRTLDPDKNAVLDESPWSEKAQDYLTYLLSRMPSNPQQVDPDYLALKAELQQFGQKEPGIISPDGILVDGNTRCAALRELGVKDIRVGVLPADTDRRDINNVELALQLRRDKRRDYSYINRLIAIEEELAGGRRDEDVARDFNIKPATLQRDRWVYETILDAIERSSNEDGTKLRLVDFEEHQEKLRELHRDYVKLAKMNSESAEQLKESRLAMVVLNYPKTSLRLAEGDFFQRYVEPRLPDGVLVSRGSGSNEVGIPGLDGVKVDGPSVPVQQTRELTNALLRAEATVQAGDHESPSAIKDARGTIKNVRDTFDVAVRMAGKNAELQKRQTAVPDRLTDAAEYINQAVEEFAGARAKRALDEEAFDDALVTLKASLTKLAKQSGRAFDQPGDGVAWLLQSVETR